jgi:hypothetical protein
MYFLFEEVLVVVGKIVSTLVIVELSYFCLCPSFYLPEEDIVKLDVVSHTLLWVIWLHGKGAK